MGLLGPNGAGKTTSFYMIVGLITPNGGRIFLDDQETTKEPVYKRAQLGVGYLAQEASVFRRLSVEDNIRAVLEMTKMTKEEQKDRLEEMLDEFGLQHIRKSLGIQLSGGERRRTEIARALSIRPKFILLDEPFAGVDPIAVEDIQNIVQKLKDKNIGILITDHNVQETLSITSLASSTYEGLPEIVLIEDYRIQGYLRSFPDDFADLSSIAKPEDFAAFKTAVNVVDGKLYGIPFDSGVAAIFYRLDVLEQAGYSEADMQDLTWEEFIKIGEDVKAATGMNLMTMDPSDVGQLRMMLQSAGSWYTDPDGKVTVAGNKAMEDAINTYIDLYTSDVVVDHVGWDKWLAGFHNGEVWTVPTGCWISASVIAAEEQRASCRSALQQQ